MSEPGVSPRCEQLGRSGSGSEELQLLPGDGDVADGLPRPTTTMSTRTLHHHRLGTLRSGRTITVSQCDAAVGFDADDAAHLPTSRARPTESNRLAEP